MAIQKLSILDFLNAAEGSLVLDVRSPGEYSRAHLPGAHSFPLFSDEERKVVGTAYKQESREWAIKLGLDFFGPRMRPFVERAEELHRQWSEGLSAVPKDGKPTVYVYCWRGGMRSAAIAWLLDLYGFRVFTLVGGYKAFRNYVLQSFERPYPLKVIGGYTGSGKTEVLHQLRSEGARIIDLEELASHRGSAFGSYRMPTPPRQEMFDNLLAMALRKEMAGNDGGDCLWVEDESQRIGDNNIPLAFWNTMRSAPLVFLEVPFEERLRKIVADYGGYPVEKMKESVLRISKRLGGLEAKNTLAFLEAGDIPSAFRILLQYYDKRYLKGLHNRETLPALLTRIECPTVGAANAGRLTKPQTV